MSREIKFRAWSTIRNEWVSGLKLKLDGTIKDFDFDDEGYYEFKAPEKYVIEQYTGLKDKNGKEIYEGDILETCCGKAKVYFDEEYCSYKISLKHGTTMRLVSNKSHRHFGYEIIGNIHENGELLGGKE